MPRRVVIVGGGIAAVEAVLALHDLAGPRVSVTVIAPEEAFSLRPLTVAAPFGRGPVGEVPLAGVLAEHGGAFLRDAVSAVDPERRRVRCRSGEEAPYDALLLATGAGAVPALDGAITFDAGAPGAAGAVVEALELGWARSVAFVVPAGRTWPLPLYELALLTAQEVGVADRATLHVVTPEPQPLAVFGAAASGYVAALLRGARIAFHGGATARLVGERELEIGAPTPLWADKIVALPVLTGRAPAGVPSDAEGFVPVDGFGRVRGLTDVWAAGDGTDQSVKQGGIACQQADLFAAQVAAAAGAPGVSVPAQPPELVLRGRVYAGVQDVFITHTVGGHDSTVATTAPWSPPSKVWGRYLSPYLAAQDIAHEPAEEDRRGPIRNI